MSWLFSQVLVEEFSEDISWDGEPSALWNGTPTQHPSWCSDRTMAHCQLSRSGMTYRPLTGDHGEAVLMSFLEAFPARTSAQPEKEQESMASEAVCGDTWQELLVKFDRASSSWKTAHCLWEEDLPESSVRLPRWGMMRDGECWEREMPEHLTSGTESGSWPTPTTIDNPQVAGQGKAAGNPKRGTTLGGAVKMWPTPRSSDSKGASSVRTQRILQGESWHQFQLREAVRSTEPGGQLNPTWVEAYLLGWPVAWTSMEPMPKEVFQEWERTFLTGSIVSNALETDKCPSVQPWLGES